ncbi:hypothetical protein ASD04_00170 [Devosia sp. Root436]|uniref:hypothetical protein n=1 Tax=Devosia sp. Root436 TaxID=1736537 RepID=UPI0006F99547|nr:hypothetical protein [Devosia sp. Root436]KQX42425.1 hypothetical protein ASD04_00170 [Devosia sp. Root436]
MQNRIESVRLFGERLAHHVANGQTGRAAYLALAADPTLPINFSTEEAAAIVGVTGFAMAKRRARGQAPSYIAVSSKSVHYPRALFCEWLASIFVDRSAA